MCRPSPMSSLSPVIDESEVLSRSTAEPDLAALEVLEDPGILPACGVLAGPGVVGAVSCEPSPLPDPGSADPDIRTSGPSGPAGADSPRALSVSGPAGGTISIWLVLAYPVRWQSGVYCETGHPVSGPSGYQYPTDWYPIRSGPGTEIDFGVIRPDAPDYLTGPVTTPVQYSKRENVKTSRGT